MTRAAAGNRFVWLAIGVMVGSLGSAMLPHQPLYAMATHGEQGFAIATGILDDGIEGIYVLDYLTGDLKGYILTSPNTGKPVFGVTYEYNVLKDFAAAGSKSPRFLMVTGEVDLRRTSGNFRLGRSAIYIAEVNSGLVAAYGIPTGGKTFVPLDMAKFRTVAIRQ